MSTSTAKSGLGQLTTLSSCGILTVEEPYIMDLKDSWELAVQQAAAAKRTLIDAEDAEREAAVAYLRSMIPNGTIFKARHMYGPERTWRLRYVDDSKIIKWICEPLNKNGSVSNSAGAVVFAVNRLIEATRGS